MATVLASPEVRAGFSGTRPPGGKGKWHRISHDDTACDRSVRGNWDLQPAETIDENDLCRHCWGLNKYGVMR